MKPDRWLATVLFTDIVGSTERAVELGDQRWRELLQAHHAAARRELQRYGGRELNTTGDGFLATFEVPERAIRCACAIRDAVRRLGIEIRAGLHTGEVELIERTVGGVGVHIGARVAAQAGPGEVLVSGTVRDMVTGSGFGFEDRGAHELKGVPGEWRLFAVTSAPVRLPVASFWSRAREARLPRVLLLYLASSAAVLWGAVLLRDELQLPSWMLPAAVLLLLIGLVIISATAWVQSHPLTAARAEREEVPGSWEIDLRDVRQAVARGRLPHLTWGRTLLGGVFAFSLLFGLAGLYVVLQDRGRVLGPTEVLAGPEPALAVLPFRVVGSDMELWREGMVDLLSTNLDGAAGIRTIAPRTVLSRWRATVGEAAEPSDPQALQVAREVGAKHALLGSMVALGGEVRLTARVHDLESGRAEGEIQVKGAPDSVPALVDRLSIEVLRQAVVREPEALPEVDLRRVTTTSLPALKAYLAGEQSFRRSRWQEAVAEFTRAIEADSTFALALYRLSLTFGWSEGATPRTLEYAERAARFADRLPEREALLLRGWNRLGSPAGIQTLELLTSRYPDDAEGWYLLGDGYYHGGGPALIPQEKFRQAFRRALSLDPSFGPAYIHPMGDAFARNDSAAARQMIARYRQIDPAGPTVEGFGLAYALAWGDSFSRRRAHAALGSARTEALGEAILALHFAGDFWREEIAVSRALLDERHPAGERGSGRPGIAHASFTAGRIRDAGEAWLSREDEAYGARGARDLLAWHMVGHVDSITTDRVAEFLASDTTAPARFLIGALAVDEKRWDDVEREIQVLEGSSSPVQTGQDSVVVDRRAFAEALRGYSAARRGNRAQAIGTLEGALPRIAGGCPGPGCEIHNALRYELGKLLLEQGDLRRAERYLRSVELYSHLTPSDLYLGKVYEALGDFEEARLHYERFVGWWRDCDPELRPLWEEGRQALNRLRGVQKL